MNPVASPDGSSWKVLVADRSEEDARGLERILSPCGCEVTVTAGASPALELLKRARFDVLLTGRLLGKEDGLDLIRRVRREVFPVPLLVLRTALSSERARAEVLASEADDFLLEPLHPQAVLATMENALLRLRQPAPALPPRPPGRPRGRTRGLPPFAAVALAASTGGPEALSTLLRVLPADCRAAFLVVQHGPPWMLETFAERLRREGPFPVELASEGVALAPGRVYLAPGGRHLCVEGRPPRLALRDEPPENFLRPAADPLFRTAADAFGPRCLAVVLTGMGRDGALGAARVLAAGGGVLAQDPESAVAPSMPQTLVAAGIPDAVLPLEEMAPAIAEAVSRRLAAES
jgi:two-component system chemotaxis response regulator CheB